MPACWVILTNGSLPVLLSRRLYLESLTHRSTLPVLSASKNTGPMAEVDSPFCPKAAPASSAISSKVPFPLLWKRKFSVLGLAQLLLPARSARREPRPQGADRADEPGAGPDEPGRRSGAASAGVACLQGTVHLADHGGAGHRIEWQRVVALGLHRQG